MKVNSLNDKIGCIFFPSDDYEVEFDMKSTDTIHDLKLKFEEEEGIPPEHQSYFSGPVELEDETLVSTLVEVFGNTLDVKLRKAAMMSTNHDITIVYGKGRKKFEKVHLKAGLSREIKLKHNKFGIVTHVFENKDDAESGGKDNNVYTVERYKLPNDKEQTIVLKSEGNNTVAYLATDLGEVQLHPEVMEYKMGTSPIELLKNVLKTGGSMAQIISAVNTIVSLGKKR